MPWEPAKPSFQTPYWYATEMLAEGRGRIVPFRNPDAMAEQIIDLLGSDVDRHAIRKKAYIFSRDAVLEGGIPKIPSGVQRGAANPHPDPPSPAFLCGGDQGHHKF